MVSTATIAGPASPCPTATASPTTVPATDAAGTPEDRYAGRVLEIRQGHASIAPSTPGLDHVIRLEDRYEGRRRAWQTTVLSARFGVGPVPSGGAAFPRRRYFANAAGEPGSPASQPGRRTPLLPGPVPA